MNLFNFEDFQNAMCTFTITVIFYLLLAPTEAIKASQYSAEQLFLNTKCITRDNMKKLKPQLYSLTPPLDRLGKVSPGSKLYKTFIFCCMYLNRDGDSFHIINNSKSNQTMFSPDL